MTQKVKSTLNQSLSGGNRNYIHKGYSQITLKVYYINDKPTIYKSISWQGYVFFTCQWKVSCIEVLKINNSICSVVDIAVGVVPYFNNDYNNIIPLPCKLT